ncbi:hypothetical protein YC2023_102127 [Brassica napus]
MAHSFVTDAMVISSFSTLEAFPERLSELKRLFSGLFDIVDCYIGNLCKNSAVYHLLLLLIEDLSYSLLNLIFCVLVTFVLYITTGRSSSDKSSSLKPHVSGNLVHDWDGGFCTTK